MIKKPYIVIPVAFPAEEDIEQEEKFESLGIKNTNEEEGKKFEILPRIIFTDSIGAIGPSSYAGLTTIHMQDGFGFLAKATMEEIFYMMCPEEVLPEEGPEEDDFII